MFSPNADQRVLRGDCRENRGDATLEFDWAAVRLDAVQRRIAQLVPQGRIGIELIASGGEILGPVGDQELDPVLPTQLPSEQVGCDDGQSRRGRFMDLPRKTGRITGVRPTILNL